MDITASTIRISNLQRIKIIYPISNVRTTSKADDNCFETLAVASKSLNTSLYVVEEGNIDHFVLTAIRAIPTLNL